jgi:FKBP-type peptidyl-prolyl cis-trans isomerase FkpA
MTAHTRPGRTMRTRRVGSIAFPLLAIALLTGCSEFSVTVPDALAIEDVVWANSLGIRLGDFEEQASGLWIRVDHAGAEGDPSVDGDEVTMEYDGWLPDGRLFDTSQFSGPIRVRLGLDPLIPGFEEGIMGMRVGDVRTLLIPPHLGYGPQFVGQIPPNSWLVFRVERVTTPGFQT